MPDELVCESAPVNASRPPKPLNSPRAPPQLGLPSSGAPLDGAPVTVGDPGFVTGTPPRPSSTAVASGPNAWTITDWPSAPATPPPGVNGATPLEPNSSVPSLPAIPDAAWRSPSSPLTSPKIVPAVET